MAWKPYALEERDYNDLPDALKQNIDPAEWADADELQREALLMDLGVKPRPDRE